MTSKYLKLFPYSSNLDYIYKLKKYNETILPISDPIKNINIKIEIINLYKNFECITPIEFNISFSIDLIF